MVRFIIIFLIFFSLNATHGNAEFRKFYSINALHGISVRIANSICKDDNGFIWVSSKTGILRLTEDDHRIYELPYENSSAIIVRLVYRNSNLYAFSNNGEIFQYNAIFDRFELILNLVNIFNTHHIEIYNVLADDDGVLWIALNSGLYRYIDGQLHYSAYNPHDRYQITWFDEQHLIYAGAEGIAHYNIQTGESKSLFINNQWQPFSVSSLYYDKQFGKLWIGTIASGLFCLDLDTGKMMPVLARTIPKQPILAISENSENTLLIGIDGQGIWELNRSEEKLLHVFKENAEDPYSIRGNGVYDILYEPGKRVWISTISGGVSFYELATPAVFQIANQINNPASLANNEVNDILEDSEGKLWFATNNGISIWNPESGKWKRLFHNNRDQAQVFLTLCEDNKGRIWAGSYSSGFYVLDRTTGRQLEHYFSNDRNPGFATNFIFDISSDSDGDLWIGGVDGAFVSYRSASGTFYSFWPEPVSSFVELEPGKILMGLSYGLSILNKNTKEKTDLLSGILVQDILVKDETIWIGTSGEGLIAYNMVDSTTTRYNTQMGLPSNFVNSIVYSNGFLWLGTENGLCRFDPTTKSVRTFKSVFPLAGVSFNKSAVRKLQNGFLAWGTNQGALVFNPESLPEIPSGGNIFIQDIMISGRSLRDISSFHLNKPVDLLESLSLNYTQNTISLELLALGAPSGAKFSWFLDGFDKDWYAPSGNKLITYTNLPSGRYNLVVRLWDNSMVVSERTIVVRIIPPFWRKSWFLIIAVVALFGVIILYTLYYINRLKQIHTQEKIRFFTNTAHDIRTSLTLIKAPVEELTKENQLSESGNYNLQLALNQTRQLSDVVTQLMDFEKMDIGKEKLSLQNLNIIELVKTRVLMFSSIADIKKISLGFESNCDEYFSGADEIKMEKIIDNLISNALKYSPMGSQIQVDLKCEKDNWTLRIKDQGIGISQKAQSKLFREFYRGDNAINSKIVGSGIGLLLVKKYVSLHGGEIKFESQEKIGSTFTIIIPHKELSSTENTNQSCEDKPENPMEEISRHEETEILPLNVDSSSKEMKILIVEDNEDLLHFMQATLSHDFNISVARDGNEAWNYILKQQPDLVVSDINMPIMDGFTLCRLMKTTYDTSHIPIILLTSLIEKNHQLNGLGLGADDYLTKPFDMIMLIQRIKSIIHNRKIVREKVLKTINPAETDVLSLNEHNDKFLKKMLQVVKTNMSNTEFDKDSFASAMNVSPSLLYKKIKALTHLSPSDFIKTVRLNHAAELLQTGKYTITEISEQCGFARVGYFSTVFKKHFNKTPTDFCN